MIVYHISRKYLGKSPILHPRTPISCPDSEPDTPRICVCPTIAGCYRACEVLSIASVMENKGYVAQFHIYQSEVDKVFKPKDVADAKYTGELWLHDSTTFHHFVKMPRIKWSTIQKPNWGESYKYRILSEMIGFNMHLLTLQICEKKNICF